jgi:hypothetical protein
LFVCLFACLCVCVFVCLFVRVFVCLLYVHLSALFACLFVCLYRCPSVCLLSLASILLPCRHCSRWRKTVRARSTISSGSVTAQNWTSASLTPTWYDSTVNLNLLPPTCHQVDDACC